MEAFLHVYSAHFLNPKCYPLSTYNAFPCPSIPASSSHGHTNLTWVRGQRRSPALIHMKALFNGNRDDTGHYEDEWYAMDASKLKSLLWQALERWGLPVAFGAFAGSIIAQQALVFVASSSFIMFMAAHKVLENQGGHLNDVFSRHSLLNLLNVSKSITTRVLIACGLCVRRIGMYIYLLLASKLAGLRSLVANKQGFQRQHRDMLPLDNRHKAASSAFESQPKLTDSIIHDINACIQKVEGMIWKEKGSTHWKQLRDNLTLLKAMLATVPLKSDGHDLFSKDAPMPLGSTAQDSVKLQRRNRKQLDVDKVQTKIVDSMVINESKEDIMKGKPCELDAVGKFEGGFPLHVGNNDLGSMAMLASNGVALDQECGLFSTEMSSKGSLTSPTEPLDAIATLRTSENNGGNGSLSTVLPTKYVDYWTHHDQNGSALPSGSSEQDNKGHNSSSGYQKEGSIATGDSATRREHASKAAGLYADRRNFWIEEPQLSGLTGDCEQVKVSFTSLNDGNTSKQKIDGREERHEPKKSILDSKSNTNDFTMSLESSDAEPASLNGESTTSLRDEIGVAKHDLLKAENEQTRRHRFENKQSPSGFLNEQNSTQQMIYGSKRSNHGVELNSDTSGSTKELAFVRENPDMHALTGFPRRINEEEFQRLMDEGELAFRNGKAGLLGKIEVGVAESMLYKAADLFGSAAAMDASSVEALGFWGNTLLVHGELKLMLSRELRHMISTPDVISSYQIRRSRVNELRDNSNQVALQETFQAVCEECEELLIQAGRKYRVVLSISNSEIRALYNWGLALCFRAQLIADEGGKNACEAADKVYLAAIDKFEAIMGISRRYAPGAMLNWGLTLRDRSRLRPMNSMERIDLLQQAKQLFQDALRLQPDDAQTRSALTTCNVELQELQGRKELQQSKRSTRSLFGYNW